MTNTNFKFELGLQAEDIITGFKGTITWRVDFLTGCNQYGLQPKFDATKGKKVILNDDEEFTEKTPGGHQPFVGK